MRLTSKLFGYLYRSFANGPVPYRPITIACDDAMTWRIVDSTLKTHVSGDAAPNLSIDLSSLTMSSLRALIDAQPGYTVVSYDTQYDDIGCCALMDASGAQAIGGVVALSAYASLEWGFLDAAASVLHAARGTIMRMPQEMVVHTASGWWLDYLGSFYSVDRIEGESDSRYATRILYTVLAPKANNISIEEAIYNAMGRKHAVKVVDSPLTTLRRFNLRNESILFDGREKHGPTIIKYYCQFDVLTPIDIVEEPSIDRALNRISRICNQVRAAGTRLRSIKTTSAITDQCVRYLDRMVVTSNFPFTDTPYQYLHDGTITRNGRKTYGGYHEEFDLSADATFRENTIGVFQYGDGAPRDGTQTRIGRRTRAVDHNDITLFVATRHNARWPRDGRLDYSRTAVLQESL